MVLLCCVVLVTNRNNSYLVLISAFNSYEKWRVHCCIFFFWYLQRYQVFKQDKDKNLKYQTAVHFRCQIKNHPLECNSLIFVEINVEKNYYLYLLVDLYVTSFWHHILVILGSIVVSYIQHSPQEQRNTKSARHLSVSR